MLDIKVGKTYRTRNGKKVTVSDIKLTNCSGNLVTFPVKGSVWKKEDHIGKNPQYEIWTIEGKNHVLHFESPLDLVEEIT